jgi:hypothetical protein
MSSTVVEFVPTNYTEFYRHYQPYILRIMRSAGIHEAEVEDVAHSILVKFIQHDALHDYDPEYSSVYKGQVRKARFSTFLSGFVYTYLRHHKDVQNKKLIREPMSLDTPVTQASGDETTLHELLAPPQPLDIEDFELAHSLNKIRESIVRMGRRANGGKLDLMLFLDLVLLQVEENDKVDIPELAGLFEVSTTTISNWLLRLRPLFEEVFAS